MARGYRTYRGRRTKRSKVPIVLAALLLLVAFVLLYLSLSGSIVFSSEGIVFKNPFSDKREDDPPPTPTPSKLPGLIIVSPPPTKTPEPPPTPTPKQNTVINATYLPDLPDSIATAGIIQLAENGTINAVVIDMKHDDGTLSYTSRNQYAERAGANTSEDDIESVLKQLSDSGLYLIARVSAFKDNLVPRKIQSLSVKVQSGVIWLDRDYHGWMNPYTQEAQDYVTDISLELVGLGFDEVLLENCCYPTIGRPQLIAYGEHEQIPKIDVINSFIQNLSSKLSEKDTLLSINVSPNTILTGTDSTLGHDTASLYDMADRIYSDIGSDTDTSSSVFDTIISLSQASPENNTSQKALESSYTKFVPIIRPSISYDNPDASESITRIISSIVKHGYGWLIRDNSGLYPPAGW